MLRSQTKHLSRTAGVLCFAFIFLCTPFGQALPNATQSAAGLSAVWINYSGDKVVREELRATNSVPRNSLWNGKEVELFGARNEIVSFNVIFEAQSKDATQVQVRLLKLNGPNGAKISNSRNEHQNLFDYRGRHIELFYVRYLQIKGLSRLGYEVYDERHIPKYFRRPHDSSGHGRGVWSDRPHHNKSYPDIAIPLETVGSFSVVKGTSQTIWVDLYVPRDASPGLYSGELEYREGTASEWRSIPVTLRVENFTLPDDPDNDTPRAMVHLGSDLNTRHFRTPPSTERAMQLRDRYIQLLKRHRLSVTVNEPDSGNFPSKYSYPMLTGSLFTSERGYAGPGAGVANGIYSVGTYGSWDWKKKGKASMWANTDRIMRWFRQNAPNTEVFLYLEDEPPEERFVEIGNWVHWMKSNPGIGRGIKSLCTTPAPRALRYIPDLDISLSPAMSAFNPATWPKAIKHFGDNSHKRLYFYNGQRPSVGSFMIEDEGVALRMIPWVQFKFNIPWWFFWESTYWRNFQGDGGHTKLFSRARTFGFHQKDDPILGETGDRYSNGDGVLLYPGTDWKHPSESLGLAGPIASLRLKHWRRGLQDALYLRLAYEKNPRATQGLIERMVPRVLWEYGVNDPGDPTWIRTDISWSTHSNDWEQARDSLRRIILSGQ